MVTFTLFKSLQPGQYFVARELSMQHQLKCPKNWRPAYAEDVLTHSHVFYLNSKTPQAGS
jgi:hypothetical protein